MIKSFVREGALTRTSVLKALAAPTLVAMAATSAATAAEIAPRYTKAPPPIVEVWNWSGLASSRRQFPPVTHGLSNGPSAAPFDSLLDRHRQHTGRGDHANQNNAKGARLPLPVRQRRHIGTRRGEHAIENQGFHDSSPLGSKLPP